MKARQELRMGTWRQELRQRGWRSTPYQLVPPGSLTHLRTRGGTAQSGLYSHMSAITQQSAHSLNDRPI